jgi:transposase
MVFGNRGGANTMSMKRRPKSRQQAFWITRHAIAQGPGHPFYDHLEGVLREAGFDAYVERRCSSYYAQKQGRPSIPPGVYFRRLWIGYFERIDSERGIGWRCSDSLSLRSVLGLGLEESTPDHSSLSRIRTRLSLEVHQEVFGWVLRVLGRHGLERKATTNFNPTCRPWRNPLSPYVRLEGVMGIWGAPS